MAVRSIWKGTISFGMVAIPAKLYTATDDKRVNFHQAHRECMSRIKMPRWCPTCEKMLETADIQRVYELAEGQYVPFEDEDFQALPLKSIKVVEVDSFIDPKGLDPRGVEKSYFLIPEDVGAKAFMLLRMAMEKAGLCGVAKLAYRERDHLALVRPYGRGMLLQTLFYADELRPLEFPVLQQEAMISEKETEMALKLVDAMKVEKFDLSQYQDDYRQALYAMIEAKIEGKQVASVEVPKATPSADLAASLQASIDSIAKAAWEAKEAARA